MQRFNPLPSAYNTHRCYCNVGLITGQNWIGVIMAGHLLLFVLVTFI